jgi:hypothetical protein
MLNAEYGIADVASADGDASGPIQDHEVLDWIRRIDRTTKWMTSVCVGSLILGAAGLLKGAPATSNWNTLQDLRYFGALPTEQRFVRYGKIMTAAGVSAGIDMALQLVTIEYGEDVAKSVQLLIEYDPHPPLDSGSTAKALPTLSMARDRCFEKCTRRHDSGRSEQFSTAADPQEPHERYSVIRTRAAKRRKPGRTAASRRGRRAARWTRSGAGQRLADRLLLRSTFTQMF